jgi:glutamate-1-semialdehyde 2,1-aminomutase
MTCRRGEPSPRRLLAKEGLVRPMGNKENMETNQQLWRIASQVLPGGVCSSARMFNGLGQPFYVSRAKGSRIYDLDGREYIDLCCSFGASLLGHAHPKVVEGIEQALAMGIMCAYENEWHSKLAQVIAATVPCIDMLRFSMSGTETTGYAIKLAREYTGRTFVVKFEGHFHGFNDYLAYNYWPQRGDVWPKVTPAVQGMPDYLQHGVIVLPYNDFERVEETMEERGHEIAAVILEPVNYNSGTILPQPGYLELLRRLTAEQGALLIFDEILSGYRTGPGCIQATYGVTPDLCTLGKAIGAGIPLSVFGGKREIMGHVGPLGNAQHSGTFNAGLVAVMAANAFYDVILEEGFYEALLARCDRFYGSINEIMVRLGFIGRVQGKGARFSLLFGPVAERPSIRNYQDLLDNDWGLLNRFYAACLKHGVYFHTMLHHGLSSAHTDEDIGRALAGIEAALREVMAGGSAASASAAAPI